MRMVSSRWISQTFQLNNETGPRTGARCGLSECMDSMFLIINNTLCFTSVIFEMMWLIWRRMRMCLNMRLRQWKIDFFHLILSVGWTKKSDGVCVCCRWPRAHSLVLLHIINEMEVHAHTHIFNNNNEKTRRITVERALMASPKCLRLSQTHITPYI